MSTFVASDVTEKYLKEMLAYYKAETPLPRGEKFELEVRFKRIPQEVFESLYMALSSNKEFAAPVLECSVNIISDDIDPGPSAPSYIRKITFAAGKPLADVYQKKTRMLRAVHVRDYIDYSVSLAKEAVHSKFATSSNALIRFKVRVSFGAPPWSFDLTAVKFGQLADFSAHLKTIKAELFPPGLTAANLLSELRFDMIDSYEVELEWVGERAPVIDDLAIVRKVFTLVNPQYLQEVAYQEEIYTVAEYIVTNHNILHLFKQPSHRLKQLSNQVIALDKNTYYKDVYPPDNYYLTIKADGQRVIISINGNRCRILRSDTLIEHISGAGAFKSGEVTIVDAELVSEDERNIGKDDRNRNSNNTAKPFTVYLFDVMVLRDELIHKRDIGTRLEHLSAAAEVVGAWLPSGCRALAKNYVKLPSGKLEESFREIWEATYPFPRDGLILTAPGEPYYTTKNYKWKPREKNTIDFLAVKAPAKMLNVKPYVTRPGMTLYLLFVGITHEMREKLGLGFIVQYKYLFPHAPENYYPIQFGPSANPLAYIYYHKDSLGDIDRQIVELARDTDNKEWVFHAVRTDRKLERQYFGNDYRVAELIYLNYVDPFLFEHLWQPSDSYFTKLADDIYAASNGCKRFIISSLLKDKLSGAKWAIDLAAGRGADLHRYQEIGVENALFIDIDATAIAELVRRKFSFFAAKKQRIRETIRAGSEGPDIEYDKLVEKDIKSLTIHTLVADLKMPYEDLIAATFQFGTKPEMIDGIICNFALHYMCDTIEHIRNVLLFCARMLKVGGVFVFTVLDGASVFEVLNGLTRGETWQLQENNIVKYAIRKEYVGAKLSSSGQMISVKLPFSDTMYEEPLCNVSAIISEAAKLGFAMELNDSMSTYLEQFARANKPMFERLSPGDKQYIGMHRYVCLRRVRNVRKLREVV